MALIGTLRNKLGTWVVVFVFVAIVAFTLNDLLGRNSILLGRNNVGEIAGSSISQEEYRNAVQQQENNFRLYSGRAPGENDQTVIQQQAWELLIAQNAIEPQYKKLGVQVTQEEVEDMIWGKNVDQNLKSTPIFQNEAGEFDKNKVIQYLQYINQLPPENPDRYRWESFQENLAPGRTRIKYENLLIKTAYVTSAEAEREYHVQNDVAEIKYLFVPYFSISDSAVTVSDSELKDYYNKNRERYKTEHTASLSYITFPVVPSSYDSADIRDELKKLANGFRTTENDSLYAVSNSEDPNAYIRYTPNTLPNYISPDSLVEKKVFGPFLDQNTYKVVKISKVGKDTIYTARARHILIKADSTNTPAEKAEAKAKAERILKELQNGANFAQLASTESEDPGSARQGGDLGWFTQGQMVKPFNDAIFNATKPGLVDKVIETQFGYHIIDVTNTKDNTGYWVGVLQTEITPSDASYNDAQRKAESFQSELSSIEEFNSKAKQEGLNVLDAKDVGTGERRIGILGNAREIVRWLFNDASVGDVSQVFDLHDQFVVAVMTGETDKGYKSFEDVKKEITPTVKNKAKGRIITDKLTKLQGTLDEVASAFGNDARVYSNSDLRLNTSNLPSGAADPEVIGTAFSLENGQRSKPLAGENGVTIVEVQNKTVAPAVADYSFYKNQLQQKVKNTITYNIADAIKENSDIEDQRYKYY